MFYPPPCPSLRGTKWAWLVTERSEFDDVNVQRSTMSTINDPTIDDINDQRSRMPMMDWSTIVIRADRTSGRIPLASLEPLFRLPTSSSKFDSFPNPQNPPNQAQNASKTLPQTLPKGIQNSISSYNARNAKKCNPSIRKPHF